MPATTPNPVKVAPSGNGHNKDGNAAPLYVKCDLNTAQKLMLVAWADELETVDLLGWLDHMILEGHVISMKAVDFGFQASATGIRPPTAHVGKCLVARASTPVKALYSLMYKATMVLTGVWEATARNEELDF